MAQQRALAAEGCLVMRNEDLDSNRTRPAFVSAMIEDLRWFGFQWQEGPDCGGPYGPYSQSERQALYQQYFARLQEMGAVYPCSCSRRDVMRALQAPHAADDEPIYPGACRNGPVNPSQRLINWRFRVPDGQTIQFNDGHFGPQRFAAGTDLGDFVVWRHDGVPSYQLAVVVDDALMKITEVARGADLLLSTARQLLIYAALGFTPPAFYHCPLVTNEAGLRLAKRDDALSLRSLREQGQTPEEIRSTWNQRLK